MVSPTNKRNEEEAKGNNIFVSAEYQLIRGGIKTIFNPYSKMMGDLDKLKDEDIDEHGDSDEDEFDSEEVVIDAEVDSVTIDESTGDIIVILVGGGTKVIKPKKDENSGETKDTRIIDASGDTWVVKDGKVIKGTGGRSGTGSGGNQISENSLSPFGQTLYKVLEGLIEMRIEERNALLKVLNKQRKVVSDKAASVNNSEATKTDVTLSEDNVDVTVFSIEEVDYQTPTETKGYSEAVSAYHKNWIEYEKKTLGWLYFRDRLSASEFLILEKELLEMAQQQFGNLQSMITGTEPQNKQVRELLKDKLITDESKAINEVFKNGE